MGTVSPSSLLGGLVDLDVLDDQVAGVETLDIGVGGGVLEETEKVLGRLSGPSSAGDTELLACSKSRLVSILISIIETMRNRIAGRGNIDNSTTTKEKLKKSSWDFVPWEARPMPPAYLRKATASLCSWTFSRNLTARFNFQPLMAWAVSRVFLKETRR